MQLMINHQRKSLLLFIFLEVIIVINTDIQVVKLLFPVDSIEELF